MKRTALIWLRIAVILAALSVLEASCTIYVLAKVPIVAVRCGGVGV